LRELVRKMGIRPRDLVRTNERIYRDHDWSLRELTDDDIFSLMAKHPDLIQRPIVERGERAVLGRPIENVKALLGE
jgi:arsenate reductase (glutaredoxin)